MPKLKPWKPKYIKRSMDRPSSIGQTGGGALSARPGNARYILGYPPKPFMVGQTGQPSSAPSVTASRLMQNSYTEEDMEDFKDRDGTVGKAGNYYTSTTRSYRDSGPAKTMQGAVSLGVNENLLRSFVRAIISEADKKGIKALTYELMKEDDDDDEDEVDEASGAAAVAGFSLPLGMSNRGPDQPPSWASYMHAINGSPVQVVGKDTLKVKPMKKPRKRSRKS